MLPKEILELGPSLVQQHVHINPIELLLLHLRNIFVIKLAKKLLKNIQQIYD